MVCCFCEFIRLRQPHYSSLISHWSLLTVTYKWNCVQLPPSFCCCSQSDPCSVQGASAVDCGPFRSVLRLSEALMPSCTSSHTDVLACLIVARGLFPLLIFGALSPNFVVDVACESLILLSLLLCLGLWGDLVEIQKVSCPLPHLPRVLSLKYL